MKMFAKIIERFQKQFSRSEYTQTLKTVVFEIITNVILAISWRGRPAGQLDPLVCLKKKMLVVLCLSLFSDEMMTITTMLMTLTVAAMRLMIKM